MTRQHAAEISHLINAENGLPHPVTVSRWSEYVFMLDKYDTVVAAAEVVPLNWLLAEVRHVVVRRDARGTAVGDALERLIEHRARRLGGAALIATTRRSNFAAQCWFYRQGWRSSAAARSPVSGQTVRIWTKGI